MLVNVCILFTRDITFVDTSTYVRDMDLQKGSICKKVWLIKLLMAVCSLIIYSSTLSCAYFEEEFPGKPHVKLQ
jgi:hypothetical protein